MHLSNARTKFKTRKTINFTPSFLSLRPVPDPILLYRLEFFVQMSGCVSVTRVLLIETREAVTALTGL